MKVSAQYRHVKTIFLDQQLFEDGISLTCSKLEQSSKTQREELFLEVNLSVTKLFSIEATSTEFLGISGKKGADGCLTRFILNLRLCFTSNRERHCGHQNWKLCHPII